MVSRCGCIPLITAKMVFSEEAIYTFTTMQYNIFKKKQKYLVSCVAFAIIVLGLLMGADTWQGALLLFIGCVFITNLRAIPKHIANSLVSHFKGDLPSSGYSFYQDRIEISTSAVPVHYDSITKLVEDDDYLYIFLSPENGYMIQKSSIKNESSYESLAQLLEVCTGKSVQRYSGLFSITLRSRLKCFRTN